MNLSQSFFLLFATSLSLSAGAAPSPAQLANLTCGTNSNWFTGKAFVFDEAKAQQDIANLNKTGIRHMRFYMNPGIMTKPEDTSTPLPEVLAEISKGISFAAKEGLAVIINPFHSPSNGRQPLPAPASPEADNMVKFWGLLAAYLSSTDPNTVFLEIASEPSYRKASDWEELQIRCHKAIRDAAPRHIIIATASLAVSVNRLDSIKNLTALKPLPDDNVVYNFHFHSPMVFTHQGKDVSGFRYLGKVSGVPYPSSPAAIEAVLPTVTDQAAIDLLKAYGSGKWDRSRIKADLVPAAEWAKKNGVKLTCNEFGAHRRGAPPADRLTYLQDIRETFDELGVGWTVWGDNFGVLKREKQPYSLDEEAAKALGVFQK